MTDLDALSALLAAATPGPWRVGKSVHHDGCNLWAEDTQGDISSPNAHLFESDAALIVAAVNALPSLIEAARREAGLREAADALSESLLPYGTQGRYWTEPDPVFALRRLLHDNAGTGEQ